MNRGIITLLLLFVFASCFSQEKDPYLDKEETYLDLFGPLRKNNHAAPGHYELAVSLDKAQINRGDSAVMKIFITGYGKNEQPKIFLSASSTEILKNIIVYHSLGKKKSINGGPDSLFWGNRKDDYGMLPGLFELNGGLIYHPSKDSTIHTGNIIDANTIINSTHLITEMTMLNAPIEIHMHFKDGAS